MTGAFPLARNVRISKLVCKLRRRERKKQIFLRPISPEKKVRVLSPFSSRYTVVQYSHFSFVIRGFSLSILFIISRWGFFAHCSVQKPKDHNFYYRLSSIFLLKIPRDYKWNVFCRWIIVFLNIVCTEKILKL